MGDHTNIGWCDSTVNPTSGCDGCELWTETTKICYAGKLHEGRLAKALPAKYDPNFFQVRTIPGRMKQAAGWSDLYGKDRPDKPWLNGFPRCIFVGDLGDFMSTAISFDYFNDEVMGAIRSTAGQRHFWMLLTKRPARLAKFTEQFGPLPDNVIAMTTITDQKTAHIRIPHLMRVGSTWHGVSAEPLLEEVDIPCLKYEGTMAELLKPMDWVIIGGASGENAPACNVGWIQSMAIECVDAHVPTFIKQIGSRPYTEGRIRCEWGMKDAKGGDWSEWPQDIRLRQMPDFSRWRKGGKPVGGPVA